MSVGSYCDGAPLAERLRRRTIRLRDNAFGGVLLRLSAFGASASILGQHLRGKRLRPYAFGDTYSMDTCAFGGTESIRRERLRRDKTEQRKGQDALTLVNAFGDAHTSTDTFKGDAAADDSAEATADWVARIPARADCSETQFTPVRMELGVPGYGSRVAEGQGSTYARILTAPGVMGSRRLGPHRTTYMTSKQVAFVEMALAGAPIHWACILWKVAKYANPRHPGSYVELVLRRTRTKVRLSSLLASLDETIKDLKLKNEALRGHLALVRKLQKAVNKMRDEKSAEAEKEFAKQREKLEADLDSEQA
ncbi:hypothetical protein AXG93_1409s1020 [Marchantia polymorpha subsp. ruderalis]|uniref:Uncharacterized protein n=1 Tax=Marchantia polymorpha subsp. ruderalis TaxID=1480154 RepID=A0A176WKG2_MARPO|nr:hypothetical protein AXG93_1409s1020 [Marchantia polymorpha subsp. ruderalis]